VGNWREANTDINIDDMFTVEPSGPGIFNKLFSVYFIIGILRYPVYLMTLLMVGEKSSTGVGLVAATTWHQMSPSPV